MKLVAQLAAVALLLGTVAPRAQAQQRVVSITGGVFFVHSDTTRYERDTSALIEIDHRDTITERREVNGRALGTIVYVVRGDSVYPVSAQGSSGTPSPRVTRTMPARSATPIRNLLEHERTRAAAREDLARKYPGKSIALPAPPDRPEWPQTYILWSRVRLLQHLDTIKRVHDCPGRESPDTAVFVLDGADAVKRVRPDPRQFGFVMKQTLIGEMRSALLDRAAGTPVSIADRMPHPGDMLCPRRP